MRAVVTIYVTVNVTVELANKAENQTVSIVLRDAGYKARETLETALKKHEWLKSCTNSLLGSALIDGDYTEALRQPIPPLDPTKDVVT